MACLTKMLAGWMLALQRIGGLTDLGFKRAVTAPVRVLTMSVLGGLLPVISIGLTTQTVHAAETFVCEDGSFVAVEVHQLERMKQTNACVANYYGLEIAANGPVAARAGSGSQLAGRVPLPVRKPEFSPPIIKADDAGARSLTQGIETGSITGPSASPDIERGTYRRVRILNAASGASRWYLHTK
ncbi:MAG: hypothetical protein AAFO75_01685 [Pseudomonadota bacterium]